MKPRVAADTALRRASHFAFRRRSIAQDREAVETIKGAGTYAGLHDSSLSLTQLRLTSSDPGFVNLVVPDLDNVFAGVRTAVKVGLDMAESMSTRLRVVVLNRSLTSRQVVNIRSGLRSSVGPGADTCEIVDRFGLPKLQLSRRDVWICTYWTTAHAADIASRLGVLDRSRIIYLIQDYEPEFFPAGAESVVARSTYHCGFTQLVNSSPLARYLERREGLITPDHLVFRPELDFERLSKALASRQASGRSLIGFYARPSKPRNLFALGLSSLRVAARILAAREMAVEFVSVGESHSRVELSRGVELQSLGRLSWPAYFDYLSGVDVLLSLQATPHPSHPPLDMVAAGGRSVTNEVEGTRQGIHERLEAGLPDPDVLGGLIAEQVVRARASRGSLQPLSMDALGVPFEVAVGNVADLVGK